MGRLKEAFDRYLKERQEMWPDEKGWSISGDHDKFGYPCEETTMRFPASKLIFRRHEAGGGPAIEEVGIKKYLLGLIPFIAFWMTSTEAGDKSEYFARALPRGYGGILRGGRAIIETPEISERVLRDALRTYVG